MHIILNSVLRVLGGGGGGGGDMWMCLCILLIVRLLLYAPSLLCSLIGQVYHKCPLK